MCPKGHRWILVANNKKGKVWVCVQCGSSRNTKP